MTITAIRNTEAHAFLSAMQRHLNAALPSASEVTSEVVREATEVFSGGKKPIDYKVRFLEGAFVSRFVTPEIHNFLKIQRQFSESDATCAVISENRIDRKRGVAHPTERTAYPLRHPFRKSIGISANDVAQDWYSNDKRLSSKHPDLCLTRPYRVVIEAKYLRNRRANGRSEPAKSVYEALFYRGLAPIDDGKRRWAYDFAVALVFDGTEKGDFQSAWNDLAEDVRDALWNAANIFVMPLRCLDL